jgi:hypothetical protein
MNTVQKANPKPRHRDVIAVLALTAFAALGSLFGNETRNHCFN